MLTIIYGRAGAGKTGYCLKDAESRCRDGHECIFIVPEQNSFSVEKTIAFDFPDELGHLISVRTFTSVCADIMSICGGIAKERITEPAKVAMIRRAVISLGQDIEYYRRQRRNNSFFVLMAQTITELNNAGVTPEILRTAAEHTDNASLSLKMNEIAEISEKYNALLGTSALDSVSAIDLAAVQTGQCGYFKGKTVYLDDFSGFTVPQLRMISRILSSSDDVICTMCTDNISRDNKGRTSLSSDSARSLIRCACDTGIPYTSIKLSNEDAYHSEGPKYLEKYLSDEAAIVPNSGLYSGSFDNIYAEAAAVAAEISWLIRTGNSYPGEITVITRSTDTYLPILESTFTKYGIPYYADSADNLAFSPVTSFFRCALDLAKGITTAKIIALMKTGLTPLDGDETSLLENYTYTWDTEAEKWFTPFTGNPSGYGEPNQSEQKTLDRINNARNKICELLIPFLKEITESETGGEILSACYELFENCGSFDIIEAQGSESVSEASAAMAMINQFYEMIREDSITPAEMTDLLAVLAYSTPLETVPIMDGKVSICDAVRSRTDNPKTVFVMGLNEGLFPQDITEPQILGYTERKLLTDMGISMPENFESCDAAERYYLYKALTSPTDNIYLSCSESDLSGHQLYPCAEFTAIEEDLKPRHFITSGSPYYGIVNAETAMTGYAAAAAEDLTKLTATISKVYPDICSDADKASHPSDFVITDSGIVSSLSGEDCFLSASRIETYEKCPFSYFMRYMIGIKPIVRAEINPIEAGNLIHWTLEQAMRIYGGDFRKANDDELKETAQKLADEYASCNMDNGSVSARQGYLIGRISEQIGKLFIHIREEQMQSHFMPVDYELGIGVNDDILPMTLLTDDGRKIIISGKIDRVDLYRDDNGLYLRVIDYKTGQKEFKLNEVYDGLSIQMLLYLFTVCDNSGDRYNGKPLPAGVLYMPGDPGLSEDTGSDGSSSIKSYCTDGIILNNDSVITAMEQELKGIYIPVTKGNKGEIKITDRLASEDTLIKIKAHICDTIKNMVTDIYDGKISPNPHGQVATDNRICETCDYSSVCRYDRVANHRIPTTEKNPFKEAAQ